jgi:uncharacterized membrane protein YhaH (DUF805 family)
MRAPGELLRFWVTLDQRVSRREYLAHGVGLATLKYSVDAALVAIATGGFWTPWSYAMSAPVMLASRFTDAPAWLAPTLVVWTLPFLWIGVGMTLRRALDAGLSAWTAMLFFVPVASYVMMAGLCLTPESIGAGDGSVNADYCHLYR